MSKTSNFTSTVRHNAAAAVLELLKGQGRREKSAPSFGLRKQKTFQRSYLMQSSLCFRYFLPLASAKESVCLKTGTSLMSRRELSFQVVVFTSIWMVPPENHYFE